MNYKMRILQTESVLFMVVLLASLYIGLEKRGYQANNFLISRQKHMLWVVLSDYGMFYKKHRK